MPGMLAPPLGSGDSRSNWVWGRRGGVRVRDKLSRLSDANDLFVIRFCSDWFFRDQAEPGRERVGGVRACRGTGPSPAMPLTSPPSCSAPPSWGNLAAVPQSDAKQTVPSWTFPLMIGYYGCHYLFLSAGLVVHRSPIGLILAEICCPLAAFKAFSPSGAPGRQMVP